MRIFQYLKFKNLGGTTAFQYRTCPCAYRWADWPNTRRRTGHYVNRERRREILTHSRSKLGSLLFEYPKTNGISIVNKPARARGKGRGVHPQLQFNCETIITSTLFVSPPVEVIYWTGNLNSVWLANIWYSLFLCGDGEGYDFVPLLFLALWLKLQPYLSS